MKDEIVIAGHGGQGCILAGTILANIAMHNNFDVSQMVSYGVEARGGTSNSTVVIADSPISSPVVVNPSTILIMNQKSLERFGPLIKPNGLIILNTSEVKTEPETKDAKIIKIEATKIATEIGNPKVTNLIMCGVYLKELKDKIKITEEYIKKLLKDLLPKAPEELIDLNIKALYTGLEG